MRPPTGTVLGRRTQSTGPCAAILGLVGSAWSMTRCARALQRPNARGPATSVSPKSDYSALCNAIPKRRRVAHGTLRTSKLPRRAQRFQIWVMRYRNGQQAFSSRPPLLDDQVWDERTTMGSDAVDACSNFRIAATNATLGNLPRAMSRS